jgi:peptide deformylase
MATLEILTAPHPVLSAKAREVNDDEFGEALAKVLSDMAETMYVAPGVGLAGPQIGDGRRLVVIDSGVEPDEGGAGLLKLVNPQITARSKETLEWKETCLSVPGMEVSVKRAKHVTLQWREADGTRSERDFHEFEAIIVQHELDHLTGTVLLDRVSRFRRSRYVSKMRKMRQRGEEI